MRHRPGTFSIAVREPETGTFGVAVTTGTVAVGAACPRVSPNAAVLTQAFTLVATAGTPSRALVHVADP